MTTQWYNLGCFTQTLLLFVGKKQVRGEAALLHPNVETKNPARKLGQKVSEKRGEETVKLLGGQNWVFFSLGVKFKIVEVCFGAKLFKV